MRFVRVKGILKLFGCWLCVITLAGCSLVDLKSRMQFSVKWVSADGKTQEQLYEDQKECTHEAMLMSAPPFPGEMAGGGGGDMQVFDNCMRSKGWKKE